MPVEKSCQGRLARRKTVGGGVACAVSVPVLPPPAGPPAVVLWERLLAAPIEVKLFIVFGLWILVLFIGYLVIMIRNERAKSDAVVFKKRIEPRRDKPAKAAKSPVWVAPPIDPVWGSAGMSRREREGAPDKWGDDELPAISVMDGGWGDEVDMTHLRQSGVIGKLDPKDPTAKGSGVYVTGVNPFYQNKQAEEIEEIVDLQTQAELVAELGDYAAAIKLLTRVLRETENPAPKAWLLLFDLYAKTDRRAQYENLAAGFKILFNAVVPSWDKQKSESQKQLEDYPQVMEKVQRLWGMPTCRAFLESLLYDDRGGDRQGFMLAAYSDIIFLIDLITEAETMAQDAEERRRIALKLQDNSPY